MSDLWPYLGKTVGALCDDGRWRKGKLLHVSHYQFTLQLSTTTICMIPIGMDRSHNVIVDLQSH
ncbi:MAG: hypothetical protein KDA84_16215 [Planctomycetaceae bacterium]|nr:hypothetical protein [Planctomycetaceae bacterium]